MRLTKPNVSNKALQATQPHPQRVPAHEVELNRSDEGRVVVALCTACGAELPAVDATIRCQCGATLARDGGEMRVVISAEDGGVAIGAGIGRGRR